MTDNRVCYKPGGTVEPDQVPCSSDEYTSCCEADSICLENGFCLPTSQPYVLKRGGCTNAKWDKGCPEHCNEINGPYWLQWENNQNKQHTYCCTWFGTTTNRSYGCDGMSTFTLPDTGVLFGRALLQNVSSFDSAPESTSSSSSHDIALGVGLGVPLGTLMVGCLSWALWERRKRKKNEEESTTTTNSSSAAAATTENGTGDLQDYGYPYGTRMNKDPVEMDRNPVPVQEIMGRER
ncbi:hypothetical protein FE257_006507 [Aspergillus nanangensis]|uniref:Uncharacterized protein n=1 Tax=Aspergillus nanangensis TaxID=2582783 RepID=A0AAD4CXN3_ASPNN|nr:hypothetical protein FE257_006507 [Aspergillus nanangensis]